nr:hypothetical protein [Tanacetum cinerariifolium]
MLKNGSWLIHNVPFILKKWTPCKYYEGGRVLLEESRLVQSLSLISLKDRSNLLKRRTRLLQNQSTQEAEQVEGNGKKDINTSVPSSLYYKPPIGVVSSIHGSSPVVRGSLNATPLVGIINKLERQMLDGKLTLVDDHGKLLNKVDSNPVNSDSESDAEVAYDETA